jgi:hypothetical protein
MRKLNDYEAFKNILPYASELIGVYQSLLGWKSLRIEKRFKNGLLADQRNLLKELARQVQSNAAINHLQNCNLELKLGIGRPVAGVAAGFDSYLLRAIAHKLPPFADYRREVWDDLLTENSLAALLERDVVHDLKVAYRQVCGNGFETRTLSPQEVERLSMSAFDEQARLRSSTRRSSTKTSSISSTKSPTTASISMR